MKGHEFVRVLVVGGGGREHALIWALGKSPVVEKIYAAPGNDAMGEMAEIVDIADKDVPALVDFAAKNAISLVVCGPEVPLALGLADQLSARNIPCFGPSKAAAQLEASKGFLKDLCAKYNIPTARYGRFTEPAPAKAFLATMSAPFVIKADGLAAGKGVVIAETQKQAEAAIEEMLSGQFGAASAEIVIEEFLHGEEASFFALTDGEAILPMVAAQDHKRAFDGDKGPNTGGMGAYSPAPVFTGEIYTRTMEEIIEPTVQAMRDEGMPYCGVLYAGLMICADGPKLIEYNVRFGDPECQILMRRLQSDIAPVLMACATGKLAGHRLDWSGHSAALIVMAAKGYPGAYEKNSVIKGLEKAAAMEGVEIFHAGTKREGEKWLANGGRVLNITALADTGPEALDRAYKAVAEIEWPEGFYRSDIGWRLREWMK